MILLDTHVWWWAINAQEKLSRKARRLIGNTKPSQRAIASISIWEFAMMASRRRIELSIAPLQWLQNAINMTGIQVIELDPSVALDACSLPGVFHKDPADRIIVATARTHNFPLVTSDERILSYPNVHAVW
jgi:PIN domain nuclease of toxin-antitoxin system